MDNPLHDIDRLFRDSLEPTEETPSENVWEKLNRKLDGEDRKKPLFGYFPVKRALLLVLLIIGSGFGYLFFHKKEKAGQDKSMAVIPQKNQPSRLNSNTTKNEDPGQKNRAVPEKIPLGQTGNDTGLNKNRPTADGTIANNDKIVERNTSTIKKLRLPVTTDANVTYAISDSNRSKKAVLPDAIIGKNDLSDDGRYNRTRKNKRHQAIANIAEEKLGVTDHNKNGKGHYKDGKLFLKDIESNINKTGVTASGFKVKPDLENSGQKLLNAQRPGFGVQEMTTLQSPITFNLPNIQIGYVPLLKLGNDSTTKKAPVKKHSPATGPRFYVSVFGAPEWQGYQLQDNDDQQNNTQNQGGDTKNKIKHREDEDASLVAGIGFGYRLNRKLSIESGIRYGSYGISTDSIKLYAAMNANTGLIGYRINTSLGYGYLDNTSAPPLAIGDSMVVRNLKQSVNYLAVPLLLRYQIGKERLSFDPAMGFMFNIILGSNIRTNLGNGQQQMVSLQGLKKVSVGMLVTPSVYYRITNHISLGLEPYFNYTVSPINRATVVDSYPYGFGIGATVQYRF